MPPDATQVTLSSIATQLEEIRRLLDTRLPRRKTLPSLSAAPPPGVAEYIATVYIPDQQGRVSSAEIYGGYSTWADANAQQPLSTRAFGLALRALGYTPTRGAHGVRYWCGLRRA